MKLEELQHKQEKQKELKQQINKDIEVAKEIINQWAKTSNGIFALKVLNKLLFENMDASLDVNPNILAFEKGQRFIFNKLYFEILDPEISKQIIFNNKNK